VEEVSDQALALVVALLRPVVAAHQRVRRGRVDLARAAVDAAPPLADSTLGVVGAGRIGARLAAKAAGVVGTVLVADPLVSSVPGAEVVPLPELVRRSHAVSLHVPLTDGTRGLLDARLLSTAPRGVVVVNTSRAGVVDETALAAGVRSGAVGGVGLDVVAEEGLWDALLEEGFDNVLLTGHTGARGARAQERLRQTCADQVVDLLAGRVPAHELTGGGR
jgi:D-3-phosphoglycerate dehydrogenase